MNITMQLPVETINIDDLEEAEYNPRNISQQELTKLKNNIDEYGIVDPIIINLKNNRIVGGHQRYKALKAKGVKELLQINIGNIGWVFNTTDLDITDEDAEKILNLSLNNISGDWNEGQLSQILQELKNKKVNYKLTGFDDLDLERMKIDTEVLFEENIIGKSWDKFKKAQGEEDWKDKYTKDEENQEETETLQQPETENLSEEEELALLNEGIIRDEDAITITDEINCPNCGQKITLEMFEEDFYEQVDGL